MSSNSRGSAWPAAFGRRRNGISKPIGDASKTSGSTATGRCATRTATGSSSAAATTRLKVAGKRVGPAEVESLLVAHPLVTEAAVIGVPDEAKGTAMVAFCVLSIPPAVAGGDLSTQRRREAKAAQAETRPVGSVRSEASDLEKDLKELVAKDMGKPLAPSRIHFVSALPKTRNAKVMRRVIRAAYLGEDPGDLSALENPQAVDEIAKLIS